MKSQEGTKALQQIEKMCSLTIGNFSATLPRDKKKLKELIEQSKRGGADQTRGSEYEAIITLREAG